MHSFGVKVRRRSNSTRRRTRSRRKISKGTARANKLFTERVKQVQVLMDTGYTRKEAWRKVMAKSKRSFGNPQVIPGF